LTCRGVLITKLVVVETGETERTASEKYKDMNGMVEDSQRIIAALLGTEKPAESAAKAAQPAAAAGATAPAPAAKATPAVPATYSTARLLFAAVPQIGINTDMYVTAGANLGGLYRLTPTFSLGLGVQGAGCSNGGFYVALAVSAIFGDLVTRGFLVGLGGGYGDDASHSGAAFVGQIGYVFRRFVIQGSVGVYGDQPTVAANLGFGYFFGGAGTQAPTAAPTGEVAQPVVPAARARRLYFVAVPQIGGSGYGVLAGANLGGLFRLTPTFSLGLGVQGAACFNRYGGFYVAPAVSALFGDFVTRGLLVGFGVGAGYDFVRGGAAFTGQAGYVFRRFVILASIAVYGSNTIAGSLGFGYLF
jgi:hypothetical protein